MALGFYQHNINGRRVIAHGGDTVAFHSDLHLFLDEGVGPVRVVQQPRQGRHNDVASRGAVRTIRGPLLPGCADHAARRSTPRPRARMRSCSSAHGAVRGALISSFVSIADLLGQTQISVGEDGTLHRAGRGSARPSSLQMGCRLGRCCGATPTVTKCSARRSRTARRFSSASTASRRSWCCCRTPWYLNAAWLLPLLYASMAVLALTAHPLAHAMPSSGGASARRLALEGSDLQVYRWSRIAAVAILGVLVAWFGAVTMMFEDVSFGGAMDADRHGARNRSASIAFVGGFLVTLWYAYTVWRGKWRWTAKVWSILARHRRSDRPPRRHQLSPHRLADVLLMAQSTPISRSRRARLSRRFGSRAMCSKTPSCSSSR